MVLEHTRVGGGSRGSNFLRYMLDCFGVTDVAIRSYGNRNKMNMIKCFFMAMAELEPPEVIARRCGMRYYELQKMYDAVAGDRRNFDKAIKYRKQRADFEWKASKLEAGVGLAAMEGVKLKTDRLILSAREEKLDKFLDGLSAAESEDFFKLLSSDDFSNQHLTIEDYQKRFPKIIGPGKPLDSTLVDKLGAREGFQHLRFIRNLRDLDPSKK